MTHVVCMGGLRPSKSPVVDLKRQAPVDGENHKLLLGVIGTLSVGGRSLRQIDMTPLHECFYMGYTFCGGLPAREFKQQLSSMPRVQLRGIIRMSLYSSVHTSLECYSPSEMV